MGGKPQTSTPADRRLKENRDRPPHDSGGNGGNRAMADGPSDKPWDGSASNYSDTAAYCDACLVNENTGPRSQWIQAKCHLPVKEPGGAVNRSAMGSASAALAGGRGNKVQISPASRKKAARALAALYRRFKLDVPPMIQRMM